MRLFGSRIAKYKPVNRLEEALVELKGRPDRVPDFLRLIFHFELFALGTLTDEDGASVIGFQTLEGDQKPIILAFSSQAALSHYLGVRKEGPTEYVVMPADELLRIALDGFELVLNAAHDHPIYLKNQDIDAILSGPRFQTETVEEEESIQIGKPKSLPDNLLTTLGHYKNRQQKLKMIYFGLMVRQDQDPEYLAILDFGDASPSESERQRLQSDIYQLIASSYNQSIPMQFMVEKDQTRISTFVDNDALYII